MQTLEHDDVRRLNQQMQDFGYAVIPSLFPSETVDRLYGNYLADFSAMHASGDERLQTSHSGTKHYQVQPDYEGALGNPAVFAHPVVLQALSPILGARYRLAYYNSNISLPGSDFQEVHRDHEPLFSEPSTGYTDAFAVVVNVLLTDFTDENGSTEAWPATHRIIDGKNLPSRAEVSPSIRLNADRGSVILRDLRLWHRGTPNLSSHPRVMLSVVYKRNWLRWRHHHSLNVPQKIRDSWPQPISELFNG